jgi:UDP-N-acetyl-D-glucosamine dehydrogenase
VPALPDRALSSVPLSERSLEGLDCAVIATAHSVIDLALVVDHAPLVVDLRNAVRQRLGGSPSGALPPNVEVL